MKKHPKVTGITRDRAKDLRSQTTYPERRLWKAFRNRRLAGLKFVRQEPIGPFIVDFICREKKLIVELDGESHRDRGDYDRRRETYLKEHGYTLLRIANDDVLEDIEGVLAAIVAAAGMDAERWRAGELGKMPIELD
jgi:very-short-patch-repair endonuclease